MDNKQREYAITRTSLICIAANLLLGLVKVFAGLLSGSIAIVLDALNNITDALGSVITIAGIKLSKRRPDTNHPYGYGRIEYFSTVVISILIIIAGGTSIIESVKKIFDPVMATYSVATILIVVISVIVKFLLGRYTKVQGEKFTSNALIASGSESTFDSLVSVSTLVGAAVTLLFHISIDGIIAAIISAFILKTGIEMLLGALSDVMGNRPDSAITQAIKAEINSIDDVIGTYDLILHNYGPNYALGSVHVEVAASATAGEIHLLTVKIQNRILKKYKVFLTVGIYAVDNHDPYKLQIRRTVSNICAGFTGVINSHGVFIDTDDRVISFDVTVDFSVRDRETLRRLITEAVCAQYPDYRVTLKFDTNYSD